MLNLHLFNTPYFHSWGTSKSSQITVFTSVEFGKALAKVTRDHMCHILDFILNGAKQCNQRSAEGPTVRLQAFLAAPLAAQSPKSKIALLPLIPSQVFHSSLFRHILLDDFFWGLRRLRYIRSFVFFYFCSRLLSLRKLGGYPSGCGFHCQNRFARGSG